MQIKITTGDITASQADTVITNLFEGVTAPAGATNALNRALNGTIRQLIDSGDITGRQNEITVIYPHGAIPAQRVLIVGLGQRDKFSLETVRVAMSTAMQHARKLNAKNVATIVHGAGVAGLPAEPATQATIEGAVLGLHQYHGLKAPADNEPTIETLTITEIDTTKLDDIKTGLAAAQAITAGVTLARDLLLAPPNVATPTFLAETAAQIAADHGLTVTIGDRAWAAEHKMGAFLAVAQGSSDEPRFIILEHNADRADELDTLVFVGKGVTFDTGGISIKPTAGMVDMKTDMGGAAAVLGAMKAVAALNIPLHIVGLAPCTDNKPDAAAYRPSDVITASNGKTIEIISTDAEGRMCLADALVYAERFNPSAVIDLATLTGSCVVALGQGIAAGLFTNYDFLRDQLVAAGDASHERVWPLPLWSDYRSAIDSDVADMKNSGGRFGGVSTSAIFLREFTNYPWVHLDIAGMAYTNQTANPYATKKATGYGVRLLTEFARRWQPEAEIGANS
ncbi:MAG TPA: leucyl aminopeptidase [Anaerolineae bacterium]|nr:leucyl aminopeptidase [Anaerolineae bacterium]